MLEKYILKLFFFYIIFIFLESRNSTAAEKICDRTHVSTVSIYEELIETIHEYFNTENNSKPPAVVLEKISEIIWPTNQTVSKWYCVDELINGKINQALVKNSTDILDGFRLQISSIIKLFRQPEQPPGDILRRALNDLHVNVSYHFHNFLQVMDIESGSVFIREFSVLLYGSNAEYVNYCRHYCHGNDVEKWRRRTVPPMSFIMAKYSYWMLRYMPKKMSDYLVFDMHKSRNTKLNILHKLDGKVLKEYIEPSSNADLESPQGKTFAFALLKSARLTLRKKIEKFWAYRLAKFRDMFIRYCHYDACQKDRYEVFNINAAQLISLQYLGTNGELGMLCSNDLCSAMWMSTAGYKDYIYYGKCLEENPLDKDNNERCSAEYWKICGGWGGCLRESGPLINNQFPVLLRSNNTEKCIDCSDTATWCTQGACSAYSLHPGYPSSPPGDSDNCLNSSNKCRGPQLQLHSHGKKDKEPIEVLDEIHFSYGGPKGHGQSLGLGYSLGLGQGHSQGLGQHYRFLRGEVYSGSVLRTQHYLRVTNKEDYKDKNESTHGHLYCHLEIPWEIMTIAQQAACAQSSFTIFRPLDVEKILYGFQE